MNFSYANNIYDGHANIEKANDKGEKGSQVNNRWRDFNLKFFQCDLPFVLNVLSVAEGKYKEQNRENGIFDNVKKGLE